MADHRHSESGGRQSSQAISWRDINEPRVSLASGCLATAEAVLPSSRIANTASKRNLCHSGPAAEERGSGIRSVQLIKTDSRTPVTHNSTCRKMCEEIPRNVTSPGKNRVRTLPRMVRARQCLVRPQADGLDAVAAADAVEPGFQLGLVPFGRSPGAGTACATRRGRAPVRPSLGTPDVQHEADVPLRYQFVA